MRRAETFREIGFDPLLAGPGISRSLLDAMSRPGSVVPLGQLPVAVPPADLRPACAVLLAVLDRDVTLHVTEAATSEMREYFRFNTGARCGSPRDADFVLVVGPSAGPALDAILDTAPDAADEGVRLIYVPTELDSAHTPPDVVLELDDAESYGERRLAVRGVEAADFDRLHACRSTSRPVDLWFVSIDGWLAAIPRTTRWSPARR
jgi:alpha-D-ribose 1-methylphosphonate 5-triphosphate synthase subunit PhnH